MKKILNDKNLIIFFIGSFVSGVGTKLSTIALSDKILRLTGSDFGISLVFLLQGVPMLLFGAAAGNFIEKKNKKSAFITINFIFACTSFLLSVFTNTLLLYSMIFINGVIQALFLPTRVSLFPLLVDPEDLIEANGLRISINGAVMILGYAFAGVLVGFAGNTAAFLIDSLSFVFIALSSTLITIKTGRKPANKLPSKPTYRKDIKAGWKFIKNTNSVRNMFVLDIITNFIIAMQLPLTYVFVKAYLGGEALMAKRTGLLFSAAGVGTILGGAILGRFKNKNKLLLLSISLMLDSMLVMMFSLSRYFNLSLVIYGAMGVLGAFTGTILETVIQEDTPQNLLSRVSGFINTIVEPICILSILLGGSISQFIEAKWIFLTCAFMELVTGIYFTILHNK